MNDASKTKEQLISELVELRQLTTTLETERLQAEEARQQYRRELTFLRRASQICSSNLALDQELGIILEEVRRLLKASICSLWLIDPQSNELVCRQATGFGNEIVQGWRLALGQGLVGWVAHYGDSLIISDTRVDTRHFTEIDQLIGLELRSIISAPLRIKQHVLGAINVTASEIDHFKPTDLTLLEALAAMAAIAIENAGLYEQAQLEVSERQQAEAALRASEERLRAFAKALPDLALILDQAGQNVEILAGQGRLQSDSTAQLKNRLLLREVLPEKEADALLALVRRTIETNQPQSLEYRSEAQTNPRWFEGRTSPLPGLFDQNDLVVLVSRDITERKASEERWRRYEFIVNTSKDLMSLISPNYTYEAVNEAYCTAHGKTREEIVGRRVIEVWGQEPYSTQIKAPLEQCFAGHVVHYQAPIEFPGLGQRYFDVMYYPYRSRAGMVTHVVVVSRDLTEAKQLEGQLRQAQKMEAIGQLTGGIAHDFNNLLTVINGFAELLQMKLTPDDPLREMVEKILAPAQRAADLVSQLLAFSRKQIIEPHVLDLDKIVIEMDKMLRRIIGEDIQTQTHLSSNPWLVEVDPTQIEQVIVNLAVNARDAMPEGGRLTIETAKVVLDDNYIANHLEAQPGEHVLLAVSDTGIGVNKGVQAHIFEPFFTTKEKGEGTGLGLATVYGIVKQSGGNIWIYSEEGQGTTFKIYFPRAKETAPSLSHSDPEVEMPTGNETILLVEDDDGVRELARRVLQAQDYTLLEAQDAQEALHLSTRYTGVLHLLVTDVVMPGINGKALAEQLSQTHPEIKVLFISGYTDNAIAHHGILDPDVAFLQKPFTPMALIHKVRQVLDATS